MEWSIMTRLEKVPSYTRIWTVVRGANVRGFFGIQAILGSASLFGMTTDLHLAVTNVTINPPTTDTSRLSWATSIFYFGMLAGLYPMSLILQRFDTRHVISPLVLVWAVVCAATAEYQPGKDSSYNASF